MYLVYLEAFSWRPGQRLRMRRQRLCVCQWLCRRACSLCFKCERATVRNLYNFY